MTDLILIEKLDPAVIFSDEEATKIINQITDKVNEFDLSIETAKGRKEISSLAAKVAKSKVLIDDMGKDLVSGWKKKAKEVDIVRKKIRDELDELKVTTRSPLTEWEDNEKDRVAKHEEGILAMTNAGVEYRDNWHNVGLESLKNRLSDVSGMIVDQSWEEFEHDATVAKSEAIALIKAAIEKRQEQEDKDAELEKFRKQAEADDRARFEANAKREAEEAEQKRIIEENDRVKHQKDKYYKSMIEHIKQCALGFIGGEIQAMGILFYELEEKIVIDDSWGEFEKPAKKARSEALSQLKEVQKNLSIKAKEKDEQEKADREQAIKDAEQKAVKDREVKQAREKAEADAREADTKHRGKINREAVKALVAIGVSEDEAKTVISAIARKMIPNVTISY